MIGTILVTLIGGVIIGLLGKWVAPGDKDNIPIWLTILCGIGGAAIGLFIYQVFGGQPTMGIDYIRWTISIVVAVILVMIASMVTGRKRAKA